MVSTIRDPAFFIFLLAAAYLSHRYIQQPCTSQWLKSAALMRCGKSELEIKASTSRAEVHIGAAAAAFLERHASTVPVCMCLAPGLGMCIVMLIIGVAYNAANASATGMIPSNLRSSYQIILHNMSSPQPHDAVATSCVRKFVCLNGNFFIFPPVAGVVVWG